MCGHVVWQPPDTKHPGRDFGFIWGEMGVNKDMEGEHGMNCLAFGRQRGHHMAHRTRLPASEEANGPSLPGKRKKNPSWPVVT